MQMQNDALLRRDKAINTSYNCTNETEKNITINSPCGKDHCKLRILRTALPGVSRQERTKKPPGWLF